MQFRPPNNERPPSKTQAFIAGLSPTVQNLPSSILAYQQLKRQQEIDDLNHQLQVAQLQNAIAESRSKYGTGAPAPMTPGQLVSAPSPDAGAEDQFFGFDATMPTPKAETPYELRQRTGLEDYNAETARIKAEQERPSRGQLKVTDKNVPVIFDPATNALTVQGTGEAYNPAIHGNIVVPGAPPVLPPSQNAEITDLTAGRKELRGLVQKADETGFGKGNPYVEKLRASPLNVFQLFDTKAQTFKQMTASVKQVIGKALEGGVLRKEDEYKYDQIIPKAGDTQEILLKKAQQLDDLLKQKQQERSAGFSGAGFRGVPQAPNLAPITAPASGKPRTVTQNGYTYTLNPATGRYE